VQGEECRWREIATVKEQLENLRKQFVKIGHRVNLLENSCDGRTAIESEELEGMQRDIETLRHQVIAVKEAVRAMLYSINEGCE